MRTSGASILIVDDSSAMRTVVRDMLMRLGYRNLDEAESGKAALTKVLTRNFSVIISDWHMEPMDGLELLREVRRVSAPGANRFIMATTEASWGSRTSAKIDGADAYIVKPFGIDVLKEKIECVLAGRPGLRA